MALLEVKNLGISFGGLRAVDQFEINIKKGQLYGLIGPNGAGKSTFLKIMSGQLEPTNGSNTMTPGQHLSVMEQAHYKYEDNEVLDTDKMKNTRLYKIK